VPLAHCGGIRAIIGAAARHDVSAACHAEDPRPLIAAS
jgi:hypothetical protein